MLINLKKIILIVVFILVACGLGFGLYYLFFKPIEQKPPIAEEPTLPGVLPPAGEAPVQPDITPPEAVEVRPGLPIISEIAAGGETEIKSVVKEIIQSPILDEVRGEIFYYNEDKNEFYKIDADGKR